jgi:phenazine biosynthesis protein phzE
MTDYLEPPFALLRREGSPTLELLRGDVTEHRLLADLPRGEDPQLALVPYRQLRERGDECHDDGAPLLSLRIDSRIELTEQDLPAASAPRLTGGAFDLTDEDYARQVAAVLANEIAAGEGANFVLRRTFTASCDDALDTALGAFRNLLTSERNAYWTFLIHTGDRIMVGATPERHVRLRDGIATMNPISGTLRRPPATATRAEVLAFLADPKERDELAMVVDEELKMLAEVGGHGRVRGPFLKEMANLAHTEYYIEAATGMDPREILRTTMFAPTATGSPIRNALRVIKRHETSGRGYYGGVAALIEPGRGGPDTAGGDSGREQMDACLMLRVAYLDPSTGDVRIPVGATLVRGSDPAQEVLETHAKAAGVLRAFGLGRSGGPLPSTDTTTEPAAPTVWADDPEVRAALSARNERLAPFWLTEQADRRESRLDGRSVLIVDNEDAFTSMLAVQLRALGLQVTRTAFDLVGQPQDKDPADYDLVVLGPGPGDPRDLTLPKIRAGRALLQRLLAPADGRSRAVLGICLGHQMICGALGFELIRKTVPSQGDQQSVDLFGRTELVGFYNSFAALAPATQSGAPAIELAVREDHDLGDHDHDHAHALGGGELIGRELIGLRARLGRTRLTGLQFHPESILTRDGLGILRDELLRLLEP